MDPRSAMCPWPAVWLWYSACFARLGEADAAYELVANTLRDDGLSYRNLFNKSREGCLGRRVFQVDGNTAFPAAVAEMLMQSHGGEIKLLPALPKAWPSGRVKGLITRGAFELSVYWKDGKLEEARIISRTGNRCKVRYERPVEVTSRGMSVATDRGEPGIVEFETVAGGEYTIRT